MSLEQTEAQAKEIRHEVVRKLGPDWTGRVWENIGWRVVWYNGALKLHYEPRTRTFWAMVVEACRLSDLSDLQHKG